MDTDSKFSTTFFRLSKEQEGSVNNVVLIAVEERYRGDTPEKLLNDFFTKKVIAHPFPWRTEGDVRKSFYDKKEKCVYSDLSPSTAAALYSLAKAMYEDLQDNSGLGEEEDTPHSEGDLQKEKTPHSTNQRETET